MLATGKAQVDGLDVREVAPRDDALFDEVLEDALTAAPADAEFVGQRADRFRHAAGAVDEVAHAPLVRLERLLDIRRPDPQQVHAAGPRAVSSREYVTSVQPTCRG